MTAEQPSALAVRAEQTTWTPAQLAALRSLGVDKAEPGDLALFLAYAQRTGLDPFSRQLYFIGRWDSKARVTRWTIQASIDALRIVAQRSGEYEGQEDAEWYDGQQWHDVWALPGVPVAARVGVYRRGHRVPTRAVAHASEYASDTNLWRKMPALMLAKCAEALALRKAFPHDLSGIYTAEEMTQADGPPRRPVAETAPPLTVDDIAASALMAVDDDELRACWQAARSAGLLDADIIDKVSGEAVELGAFIMLQRERRLQPAEPEPRGFAEHVAEADPVDAELVDDAETLPL